MTADDVELPQFEFGFSVQASHAPHVFRYLAMVSFNPTPYLQYASDVEIGGAGDDWWEALFNALQKALLSVEWRVRRRLDVQVVQLQRDGFLVDEEALRRAPEHLRHHVGAMVRRPEP